MFDFLQGEQYMDTGWIGVFITILVIAFILYNVIRSSRKKKRKDLFIRRIAGLNAIDDAIGRATEMGRPVLMVPGIGALDAIAVQAINIFAQITKKAAQFSTPVRICCANAPVYAVAQEIIRDVYIQQGVGDRFTPETVQFISDQQFAFAAGVSGMIHREKVAATFLLGAFYAESLIFAETSNAIGAIQVAGSTQSAQTPFFIAACDYVLIGDEFYAASAYLTREPVLVGSLVGQDWAKILVAALVVFGTLIQSVEMTGMTTEHRLDEGGGSTMVPNEPNAEGVVEPDRVRRSDTSVYRMFNPYVTAEQKQIERLPNPEAESDEAGAGE